MKAVRLVVVAAAIVTSVTGASLPMACSSDAGTSGKRLVLDARIAAAKGSTDFTNAAGWRVKLAKALVATGPLYYYDGETIFAARTGSPGGHGRRVPSLRDLLGIRSAFAHPGHYVPGNAKGEMLTASSADLLIGTTLGTGRGISGPVRSATFSYGAPAAGPLAAELGSNAIVLEGTAEKGEERRVFRAEISLDETKGADGKPQIEGCPFTPVDMAADGVVTVEVSLPLWFDQVEFDAAPKSTDGSPVALPAGLARNQLVRGVKVGLAYSFSYAPR